MNSKLNVIPIETDVLIIGGGLAGCMAGIKASETEANVTIAEKGNIVRSGQAASGIDHTWAYVPPVHGKMGYTLEDLVEDHTQGQAYGFINKELLYVVAKESYNRVLDLERFGLKIRYDDSPLPGKFRIVPQFHSVPSSLNYDGRNIKPKLASEVTRRGVNVINRIMMTDLLVTDGHVSGALGIGTRTGDIYFFKAKAVILCTGRSSRLYRSATGTDFNLQRPAGQTGDGRVMALKAGCRLISMEFTSPRELNIGPYQQSMGAPRSTTWPAGALVNADGKTIIRRTYFTDWEKYLGEGAQKIDFAKRRARWLNALKAWPSVMESWQRGEGPFYLDLTGGTEEEIKYIEWSMSSEGKGWLFLRHLKEEGIDLRKDKIEFTPNNAQLGDFGSPGVMVNKNCETEVKGLFIAGDEIGGFPWSSSQGALGTGWLTGDLAAKYARKQTTFLPVDTETLESLIELCSKMLDSKTGVHWKEVERAVQDMMDFYCNGVKTEQTLKRGIERIKDVRDNVFLKAENTHELMRCLEVRSIMDNAELVMRASIERKETRKVPFEFVRMDFPEQDDENWFAFLSVMFKDGKFKFSKIPLQHSN